MNYLHHSHADGIESPKIASRVRTSNFAMQASFISSSIEEEDFIDNVEPNLIASSTTDSYSSHVSRTGGENEELNPDLCNSANPIANLENDGRYDEPTEEKTITSNSAKRILNHLAQDCPSRPPPPKTKLSLSMHDISTIPAYPLTPKSIHFSSSTIQSHSMTTNASIPKSKDSGFPRSSSCISLNSGRSYVHVQSKVKEYIKQIKAENDVHRRNSSKVCINATSRPSTSEQDLSHDDTVSVKTLVPLLHKLKDELDDKDKMLSTLQENYDSLLLLYAKSKITVDHLRCRPHTADVESSPFNFDTSDYKKPKASPNVLLLPKLHELQREPSSKRSKHPHNTRNQMILNPIVKTCSSSVRLDKPFVQSLLSTDSKEVTEYPSSNSTKYKSTKTQNPKENSFSEFPLQHMESDVHTNHQLLINKELSPERLNNQFVDNPFIKVKRWQESLPSFELIEPGNNYDSLNSHSSHNNETSDNQYFNQNSSDSISSKQNTTYVTKDYASIHTNSSNLILSRSISQPNNCFSFEELAGNASSSSFSQSSAQFCKSNKFNFHPHWIPQLSKNVESINDLSDTQQVGVTPSSLHNTTCRSKTSPNLSAPNQLLPLSRHKTRITDTPHLNRKKLLGQRARVILFEYLKSTNCKTINSFNHISKNTKQKEDMKSKCGSDVKKELVGVEPNDIIDDEEATLSECLDVMNQCCTNVCGKSEAIMQMLAKQLKNNL